MRVVFGCLYHTQIIHLTIAIEVEVRDTVVRVVQFLLKLLEVLCLTKERCNGFQIEVRRDIAIRGGHRNRLVCKQHTGCHQ